MALVPLCGWPPVAGDPSKKTLTSGGSCRASSRLFRRAPRMPRGSCACSPGGKEAPGLGCCLRLPRVATLT
eukprot:9432202-Alexandrium_andersonii.AAC.1